MDLLKTAILELGDRYVWIEYTHASIESASIVFFNRITTQTFFVMRRDVIQFDGI